MAVRIPVYERTVQLDSASHTIPRYHPADEPGKAVTAVGNSLIQVAAHWKNKQDSFALLQMHQNVGVLQDELRKIQMEEAQNFNPATDPPGTYHDRVAARSQQAVDAFRGSAPPDLQRQYDLYGHSLITKSSIDAAQGESASRNAFGKQTLDKMVGQILQQVERNPDSADAAVGQVRKSIKDLAPVSGLTTSQQAILEDGYLSGILNHAVKGYQAQGRIDEGRAFVNKFVQDRKAEGAGAPALPGQPAPPVSTLGPQKAAVDPSKYDTKLTPTEEAKFQDWKKQNAPNDSGQDYDLRGAFKAGVVPDPQTGHMPDTYKKPNHPTFSDESQYANDRPDLAGKWTGPKHDVFVPPTAAPAAGPQGAADQLNQKRIAEIDKNPEVAKAIEKAAADNGLDPNQLKVFASIESSGNPKDVTGSHHGLFNLTKAEFGMNGGGNIYDAQDNANAAAKVLAQKKDQLTTQLGREPTATELYGAHNQGMGGVTAHIQNPDQPAWKSMLQTKEGQDRIQSDGQAGAEQWAKRSIVSNVPSDVTQRLYGGDASKITSREFMAIQGTRVKGGSIDDAISAANQQQPAPQPRTIVASADGQVISDTRPPAYIGGVNYGGPAAATPVTAGPGPTPKLDESGAHGYSRGNVAVAPWLVDTVRQAAQTLPEGYHAKIISTVDPRDTGTVWHPTGRAIDIQIYDDKGNKIPNVGDERTPGWDVYKNMAAAAKTYAIDKWGKDMTWGGHFNTGTPYDRMHFQVGGAEGGGSARGFTPQDLDQGRQAMSGVQAGPVQVAGPPTAGTGAPSVGSVPLSRWEQQGQTAINTLDGGAMKAAGIQAAMKSSLKHRIDSDIASTQVNGTGITLPPDLQKYYGTDKLTFDFISAKLGTGAAIEWNQNKDYAQKIYNGGNGMESMPRDGILQRLQEITPDPNSANFLDQQKVYNAVLKKAQVIDKERNSDPAGYANKDPVVAQLYAEAQKDPNNQEKVQALVTARMNQQKYLGIPDALRTPLMVDEAKVLAQPLLDRARPDRESGSTEVAQSVLKFVGKGTAEGVPDLAHRALQTVLRTKGITDQQAAATADALVTAQQPLPTAPLTRATPSAANGFKGYVDEFGLQAKDGYYLDALTGQFKRYPSDNYADNPDAMTEGRFQPGTRFIPADHIQKLLADPTLSDLFDRGDDQNPGYGDGAAEHFLNGGKNTPTNSPIAQPPAPNDALSQPVPDAFQTPQPDVLTPPDQQDQTDQTDQQGP